MLDLAIVGGTVIDGSGAEPVRADVGIVDGRVAVIDPDGTQDLASRRTIDADGLVVAPGFVDIHTHFDAQLFWDPACTPSSLHGITTIFCGNCGFSIAPLGPDPDYVMRMLARVEGIPLEALEAGVPWSWSSFDDYLTAVERSGTAVNVGVMVGHSAIRSAVLGDRCHDRDVSASELAAMTALVAEALEAGAAGFSSSWGTNHFDGDGEPVPSRSATSEELVQLAGTLARYPGSQLEFIPTNGEFEQRHYEVMTAMALAAQTTLNWNILIPRSQEWVDVRMEASRHAAAQGARVLALSYPDVMRTRVCFVSPALAVIPDWAPIVGLPLEEKQRALRDPLVRARLRAGAEKPAPFVPDFEAMLVGDTQHPDNEVHRGRRIGDIAKERQQHPIDVMFDIALVDELRTIFVPAPPADDDSAWAARRGTWKDPRVVVGASDGGAHVNSLCTFDYPARFLALQRATGELSLAETVRQLTSVPSDLYGVSGRGRLAAGSHADVVVFDPDTIDAGPVEWRNDMPAGAGRLHGTPVGMHHVLVNGTEIIEGTRVTGATPGRVLRMRDATA